MSVLVVPSGGMVAVNQLGPDTLKRCQRALELWRSSQFDYIVVTGGRCYPPTVETQPAAISMRDWLCGNEVPPSRILMEVEARDTYGNIKHTVAMLRRQGISPHNITVISHWMHCIRFWITARRACRIQIKTAPLFYSVGWKGTLAEGAMIAYHLCDREGNGWIAVRNRASRTYPRPGDSDSPGC